MKKVCMLILHLEIKKILIYLLLLLLSQVNGQMSSDLIVSVAISPYNKKIVLGSDYIGTIIW